MRRGWQSRRAQGRQSGTDGVHQRQRQVLAHLEDALKAREGLGFREGRDQEPERLGHQALGSRMEDGSHGPLRHQDRVQRMQRMQRELAQLGRGAFLQPLNSQVDRWMRARV